MRRLLFILAALVAVNVYSAEKPRPTEHQVHKVIKLTKKHIPIGRYFADDEDEDDYTLVQPMIARRETGIIKHRTDIGPDPEDIKISDYARARLFLARVQALEAHQQIHG